MIEAKAFRKFIMLYSLFKSERLKLHFQGPTWDAEGMKCEAKSELCYDRQSVGQSVLMPSRIWGPGPDSCYCETVEGLFIWGALFDVRLGLLFKIAAGPRQCSHIYRGQTK
jgi:hypothetical protein